MSDGFNWEIAQCQGKERFSSPQAAHRVSGRKRKRWQKSKRKHDDRKPYRCPHCGGWHLGKDNFK